MKKLVSLLMNEIDNQIPLIPQFSLLLQFS